MQTIVFPASCSKAIILCFTQSFMLLYDKKGTVFFRFDSGFEIGWRRFHCKKIVFLQFSLFRVSYIGLQILLFTKTNTDLLSDK
jgi:hypothetical protein